MRLIYTARSKIESRTNNKPKRKGLPKKETDQKDLYKSGCVTKFIRKI